MCAQGYGGAAALTFAGSSCGGTQLTCIAITDYRFDTRMRKEEREKREHLIRLCRSIWFTGAPSFFAFGTSRTITTTYSQDFGL
jgi:hypothetical protein